MNAPNASETGDFDDKAYALPRSDASIQLQVWRDHFTVKDAIRKCLDSNSHFTVAVLGSGGCVDTLSAI